MVTGDHLSTALSINNTLGIASKGEDVATGADLDKLGSIEVPEYLDGSAPRRSSLALPSPGARDR